jgi:hypothetical protein
MAGSAALMCVRALRATPKRGRAVILIATAQRRPGYNRQVPQRNTLETNPATTVLVVGGPHLLVECARKAASAVPTAEVVACELRDAPTKVAELWPFAIVMSEDLYAFDSAEFDALARDVKARLITMTIDESTAGARQQELRTKLAEAFRRRSA